ncbi:hypothetical protein PsorP6_015526 [Peronosclerospora sorghi]|uniref:Uncharacterized protein n=1 Tax=Peronosclerospora sorghi TaxID=230839 RepID=A0ACC0WND9_9STRA|nr:hypothetical protein PsorP6_015526 [Peronosclerospora sorghi]
MTAPDGVRPNESQLDELMLLIGTGTPPDVDSQPKQYRSSTPSHSSSATGSSLSKAPHCAPVSAPMPSTSNASDLDYPEGNVHFRMEIPEGYGPRDFVRGVQVTDIQPSLE